MTFHSQRESPALRAIALVTRDWIHATPLSLCNAGADECPDWDRAYELAALIAAELQRRGFLTMGAVGDA